MSNKLIIDEEVSFTVNSKEIHGILTYPDSVAPYPALVLLHGSDRSSAKDPYYAEHAETLIRSGFAVLRYDGFGWGGKAANDASFETLDYRVEEAIAAVKYLQSRSNINAKAVGFWGISQGGWICQMAAASYDGVAFIIPVSGPGVTPAEQESYRVEAESRAAGFDDNEVAKAVLMRRLMIDIVLNEPLYQEANLSQTRRLGAGPWSRMAELTYGRNSMDLVDEFGKILEIMNTIKGERWAKFLHLEDVLSMLGNLPPQAWGMAKEQMKAIMEVDPAVFLTKVHCPVLAIFGENDTSIPVEKSITLYKQYLREAGNDKLTIKVFANASHAIRVDGEIAPGYFDLILIWLRGLPIG